MQTKSARLTPVSDCWQLSSIERGLSTSRTRSFEPLSSRVWPATMQVISSNDKLSEVTKLSDIRAVPATFLILLMGTP